MHKDFKKALAIIGSCAIIAAGIFNGSPSQGATIILTQPTSTIGDFRTNVNTSLTNLNTAVVAATFTTTTVLGLVSTEYLFYSTSTVGISTSSPNIIYLGPDRAYQLPASSTILGTVGPWSFAGNSYLRITTSTGAVQFDNVGVQSLTGSTYLNVTTATGTPTIANLGVQSLTAGDGISVTSATGTITVANTKTSSTINGVEPPFSLVGTSHLNVASSSNTLTLTNLGVTSIVAGSSTIVSNATGTVTVSQRPTNIPWTIEAVTGTLATTEGCASSVCMDHIYTFDSTSTLSKIRVKNKTQGDTITWNAYYGSSQAGPVTTSTLFQVFSSDQTTTATSTPTSYTPNASSTPRSGDMYFIWYKNASSTQSHWDNYFTYD